MKSENVGPSFIGILFYCSWFSNIHVHCITKDERKNNCVHGNTYVGGASTGIRYISENISK